MPALNQNKQHKSSLRCVASEVCHAQPLLDLVSCVNFCVHDVTVLFAERVMRSSGRKSCRVSNHGYDRLGDQL